MFTKQKALYEWWSEFMLCFVSNGKPIILGRASIFTILQIHLYPIEDLNKEVGGENLSFFYFLVEYEAVYL
jgi:hypothetical protein